MPIERIYWDSDAFLGWLQAEPGKAELCAGTLKRADQGEVIIFTSALTLAEVLWMRGAPIVPRKYRSQVFPEIVHSRTECHAINIGGRARLGLESRY